MSLCPIPFNFSNCRKYVQKSTSFFVFIGPFCDVFEQLRAHSLIESLKSQNIKQHAIKVYGIMINSTTYKQKHDRAKIFLRFFTWKYPPSWFVMKYFSRVIDRYFVDESKSGADIGRFVLPP